MKNNSVKYEAFVKQYLRTILDIARSPTKDANGTLEIYDHIRSLKVMDDPLQVLSLIESTLS